MRKMSAEERQKIFDNFNDLKNHEAQNVYLRGCVSVVSDNSVRRRPRNEGANQRNSFKYAVTLRNRTISICQAALLALHGIKASRLKKKVLSFQNQIADNRGKHDKHKKIDDAIKTRIREHIQRFPARESHYSRAKNSHKRYLDASLSIASMHRLFLKDNPDLTKQSCKYWLYKDIFNYEFNVSFGYPRSDICDKCEKYQADIKAAELRNDNTAVTELKVQHELHVRKADVFNVQLKEATQEGKQANNTAVLCLDFEKNLPLPLTGVSQEYYKRQLWLHNLCIHDSVLEKSVMYLYAEHYAAKGPNEVISCLDHYISGLPQNINNIVLFMDNCFSQNKNRYMFGYLYRLVNTTSSNITQVVVNFPIPGHSRMPCDRDFGRIEKRRRKQDKVSKPSEWVELIKTTDVQNPFTVVYVQHPLTDDMQNDGTDIVIVKDYKTGLETVLKAITGISQLRGVKFQRGAAPLSRNTMTAQCSDIVTMLKRGKKLTSLQAINLIDAYADFLPIKKAKYSDVKDLLTHINLPNDVTFYDHLKSDAQDGEAEDELEYE